MAEKIYYDQDSRNCTFREYRYGSNWLAASVAWVLKCLRVKINGAADEPPVNAIELCEVGVEDIPEEAWEKIEPFLEELSTLGFGEAIYHLVEDEVSHTLFVLVTISHSSGQGAARIHYRRWGYTHPPRIHAYPMFISKLANGLFFVSSAGKPDMEPAEEVLIQREVGLGVKALWEMHTQGLSATGVGIRTVRSQESLRVLSQQYHQVVSQDLLNRGVYHPRAVSSAGHAAGVKTGVAEVGGGGGRLPVRGVEEEVVRLSSEQRDVMTEIEAMQSRQVSWQSIVGLLLLSLVCFAGLGIVQGSWVNLWMIIPILGIHELGHYVAMRLFKYRNVRMFFVPGLGAAVSGECFNVPGWKKVWVALAGPVPSILAGIVLVILGWVMQSGWMMEMSYLLFLINAFNLLPVLPLDGGRVVHAIFFSRALWLDIGFRVLAGVGLLGVGIVINDGIFRILGIFMLVGIWDVWKQGRIVREVRMMNLSGVSRDAKTIPPRTAVAIIDRVRDLYPKRQTAKTLAKTTLQVFENLNEIPPSIAASVLFVLLQGAFFVLGVVMVFVAAGGSYVTSVGGIAGAFNEAQKQALLAEPQYTLASELPQTSASLSDQGANVGMEDGVPSGITIVAFFKQKEAGAKAFAEYSSMISPGATLTFLGEVLLLDLPVVNYPEKKEWIDRFTKQGAKIRVQFGYFAKHLKIKAVGSSEAQVSKVKDELALMLQNPFQKQIRFVAPWRESKEGGSPEQLSLRQLAFELDQADTQAIVSQFSNPLKLVKQQQAMAEQTKQAYDNGDEDEVQRIIKAQQDQELQRRREIHEKFKQQHPQEKQQRVIDLCWQRIALAANTDASDKETVAYQCDLILAELAQLLGGQVVKAEQREDRFNLSRRKETVLFGISGETLQQDKTLVVKAVLPQLAKESAVLIAWLKKQGFQSIQYEIESSSWIDDD